MKRSSTCVIALMLLLSILVFLDLPSIASSRRITRTHSHGSIRRHHHHDHPNQESEASIGSMVSQESYRWVRRPVMNKRAGLKPDTLQVAGSSLPDCSHACGSCFPCRLVMVSFVCSTLQEAETCPMAYKCMCGSKSFPVP